MFTDRTFVIVTHRFIPTLADDLKTFLIKKGAKVVFIWHEFAALSTRRSFIEHKRSVVSSVDFRFLPEQMVYLKDLFYTCWWLITKVKKADVYIGYGAFNVLPGIWLKSILGLKRIIFYTVDFSPNRFNNKLLNNLYRQIDAYAMKKSDETWNLSTRMQQGRELLWGLNKTDYPRQRVVPLGVWPSANRLIPKYSHDIFFSGHLMEKQGVQLALAAMPQIIEDIPDVIFRIIGEGEYQEELKKMTASLKLQNHIVLFGGVDADKQMTLMIQSGVAVAPYDPAKAEYSYYADSAKVKTYLSAGLPVVLTDVTHNAKEIEQFGCGQIITYDKTNLAKAVIKILKDSKLQIAMKRQSLKYIHQFDWDQILTTNFERVLKSL